MSEEVVYYVFGWYVDYGKVLFCDSRFYDYVRSYYCVIFECDSFFID